MRQILTIVLGFGCAVQLLGFAAGTPDGNSGAPPYSLTCGHCHFGGGTPDGFVEIRGVPDEYSPDSIYAIAVVLADSGMRRWGFQLTIMDTLMRAGGTIAVTDSAHTYLHDNPGEDPDYLNQNFAGTYSGRMNGPVSWTFDWNPPSEDVGPITFYTSATSCDGYGTSFGDLSYEAQVTSRRRSTEESVPVIHGPGDVTLSVTGDPDLGVLRIAFSFGGGVPAEIAFALVDSAGLALAELTMGNLDAGAHETSWTIPEGLAPGLYYLTLLIDGAREASEKVLIVD